MNDRIFKVAGMTNSGIVHDNELIKNWALGYLGTDERYKNAMPIANHDIFIGAASIYSTALDLLKFDQALYNDKLLGKKEKERMFTIVQPPYGYGWFISNEAGKGKVVSHGGDIFGYTTLIERRLKDQVLIVILGNQQSIDREVIVKVLNKTLQ